MTIMLDLHRLRPVSTHTTHAISFFARCPILLKSLFRKVITHQDG
jgi:hypothetical protein